MRCHYKTSVLEQMDIMGVEKNICQSSTQGNLLSTESLSSDRKFK